MKNKTYRTMNFKKIIFTLMTMATCYNAVAQTEGVSIKPSVGPPAASAMLDVDSKIKGVLIPRVELVGINVTTPINTATTPLPAIEKGLMVYNTNASYTTNNVPNGLQGTGFYYWNSQKWVKIGQGYDVPKVTYDQMWHMLPFLTLQDRGMFVFVTNTTSPDYYTTQNRICGKATDVMGLWFLTSYLCNSGIVDGPAPVEYITWRRVLYDMGTGEQIPGQQCQAIDCF